MTTEADDKIQLVDTWPVETPDDEMGVSGHLQWAWSYQFAARVLLKHQNGRNQSFYMGPLLQSCGMAAELTLKAMLRGVGKSSKELKKFGHNTYDAYQAAKGQFHEGRFVKLLIALTQHRQLPEEIQSRATGSEIISLDNQWRAYFPHLDLLDKTYDRPFRTRYVQGGAVVVPDAEMVLIGNEVLLSAMDARIMRCSEH
ncbi:hypothetical protein [Cohaesibacter intestini]|uniref:hypothetical protein n=1 Tax=Cohaesibacter intestini TaxID=2211145 RepID=UPI000DE8E1BE|nr:hypothetical protein [Cohaesibacter intestini]